MQMHPARKVVFPSSPSPELTFGNSIQKADGTLLHPLTEEAQTAISTVADTLQERLQGPEARCAAVQVAFNKYQEEYRAAAESYKPTGALQDEIPAPGTSEVNAFVKALFLYSRVAGEEFFVAVERAALRHLELYEAQVNGWKEAKGEQS